MPTKNTTTSTNQYNQGSMNAYNQLTQGFSQAEMDEINNPYNNMAFNTQLQMGRKANAQGQEAGMQSFQRSMQQSGISPNSPLYASQLAKLQRQGMSNNSNLYNNLLLQGSQLRQQAIGAAGAYKPLQTGQTQVQQQSGVGTWLAPIAGMAMSAATMGFGGGKGGGGGLQNHAMGGSQNGFTGSLGSQGAGYYDMGSGPTMYDPGNELQQPGY